MMLQRATGADINPWEDMSGDEMEVMFFNKYARPHYADEKPIINEGKLSEKAQRLQLSQGYLKPYYTSNIRQSTLVDQFLITYRLMTSMQALAVGAARYVDKDGNVVPLSSDPIRAKEQLAETVIDMMLPLYANVA